MEPAQRAADDLVAEAGQPAGVDVFRRFYGPTVKAFGALDVDGQGRLAADLLALCERFDRGGGAFAAPAEYLEVVIER